MSDSDQFTTVDLYEAKNMTQVVDGLHALGRCAQKNGFQGPVIGAKEGTEHKREFTEAQLKAGEGIVGMQAGAFVRHYRPKLPYLACVAYPPRTRLKGTFSLHLSARFGFGCIVVRRSQASNLTFVVGSVSSRLCAATACT